MMPARLEEEIHKAAADLERALAADQAPRPRYRDAFGRLRPWWTQPEVGPPPSWLTPGHEPSTPAYPDAALLAEARRLVAERQLDAPVLALYDKPGGRERLRAYVAEAARGPRSVKDRLYAAVRQGRVPGHVLALLDRYPAATVEQRIRAEYPGALD